MPLITNILAYDAFPSHQEDFTHTGNRYDVLPIRRQPQISALQGIYVSISQH